MPVIGQEPLLSVRDLRTWFRTDAGVVKAVDGVSFDVHPREVLAVVGESGSGKSITAMSVLGLVPPPGRIESGEIVWKGRNLVGLPEDQLRDVRGGEIGIIFQDPTSSLNPVHTIGHQISEMVRLHTDMNRKQARVRAIEMLDIVGIPQPGRRIDAYPHEFSGGMRQRAMIAMAIACEPDLLIADEPTTALDVTIQAQVLEVLHEIRERTDCAILLITHDLGVVAGVADNVVVMYAGRPVEVGTVDEIYYEPRMPYTLGLLGSLPRLDQQGQPLTPIRGAPPSLVDVPPGCPFHPRCPLAQDVCTTEVPELMVTETVEHRAACLFWEDLRAASAAELFGTSSIDDTDVGEIWDAGDQDDPQVARLPEEERR